MISIVPDSLYLKLWQMEKNLKLCGDFEIFGPHPSVKFVQDILYTILGLNLVRDLYTQDTS